ncbi:hypothetical protein NFI96_010201 [Prochilodus magdalenae]|nr:hypothetical protein NFI96_010201 [Prochilodus magdalenae]
MYCSTDLWIKGKEAGSVQLMENTQELHEPVSEGPTWPVSVLQLLLCYCTSLSYCWPVTVRCKRIKMCVRPTQVYSEPQWGFRGINTWQMKSGLRQKKERRRAGRRRRGVEGCVCVEKLFLTLYMGVALISQALCIEKCLDVNRVKKPLSDTHAPDPSDNRSLEMQELTSPQHTVTSSNDSSSKLDKSLLTNNISTNGTGVKTEPLNSSEAVSTAGDTGLDTYTGSEDFLNPSVSPWGGTAFIE